MQTLDYALECIVWYHCHYEWLEPLADELEKATKYYSIPSDVRGTSTEESFIWMLLVGMFGSWGTSIGGGWIEKTKECAEYIRTLCARAQGKDTSTTQEIAAQIARDICRENKICTCIERDGHCVSVMAIAERLANQGYKPPILKKAGDA